MRPTRPSMLALALTLLVGGHSLLADDAPDIPKQIPLTRPEMKAALDQLKHRSPRLPLPPAEAEGERRAANNGRMRNLYLPAELRGGGASRDPDPNMSFDYAFATMLFWITSRVNNCHYCLGHQENKLLSAGVPEDQIAALDGHWSGFAPAQRAAFAFARKLTYEPHAISDEDIDALRPHYTDLQILELTLLVARYNATNRWTDALGIPQEGHREFTTPTSEDYQTAVSAIAPVGRVSGTVKLAAAVPARRPSLESHAEVLSRLAAAGERQPRLPLAEASAVRQVLDAPEIAVMDWMRLLANFPVYGTRWIQTIEASAAHGRLSPKLKSVIAWTAARHDRAWYSLAMAHDRLRELGMSEEEILELSNPQQVANPAERQVVAFTQKLTTAPQSITDGDVLELRKYFDDETVAEIVYHVTQAAFFNRLTETAALRSGS